MPSFCRNTFGDRPHSMYCVTLGQFSHWASRLSRSISLHVRHCQEFFQYHQVHELVLVMAKKCKFLVFFSLNPKLMGVFHIGPTVFWTQIAKHNVVSQFLLKGEGIIFLVFLFRRCPWKNGSSCVFVWPKHDSLKIKKGTPTDGCLGGSSCWLQERLKTFYQIQFQGRPIRCLPCITYRNRYAFLITRKATDLPSPSTPCQVQ